jgi:N-acetylmuramoyl-L-alanine amidase
MVGTAVGVRYRSVLLVFLLALGTGILVLALIPAEASGQAAGALAGKRIVLDPGHGGTDPGASNVRYGLREKDQNLAVALHLKALLEAKGATVFMTRTGDQTLSNNDRYTYANSTGSDILVSIHMNGSSDPGVDYTTALYGKPRKDTALTNAVLGGLYPALGIPKRAPYQFASGVLLKAQMPATLAETVFVTSDHEGLLLSDGTSARQQQIAEALGVGIEAYFSGTG